MARWTVQLVWEVLVQDGFTWQEAAMVSALSCVRLWLASFKQSDKYRQGDCGDRTEDQDLAIQHYPD